MFFPTPRVTMAASSSEKIMGFAGMVRTAFGNQL
jgi:hypothetical protein